MCTESGVYETVKTHLERSDQLAARSAMAKTRTLAARRALAAISARFDELENEFDLRCLQVLDMTS
jgi:hypothetical protein